MRRAIVAGLLLAVACGGFGVGDERYYLIAFLDETKDGDCGQTANDRDDSTTIGARGRLLLYRVGDAEYVLEYGGATLFGTRDGDAFIFAGETINREFATPEGADPAMTTTTSLHIPLTREGTTVRGALETAVVRECTGMGCMFDREACNTRRPFRGTEVPEFP